MTKNNSFLHIFSKSILILFLLFLYIVISAFSYAKVISTDISNNVFRLHVLANSDTDYDQELKLEVRDNILSYINSLSLDNYTKDEIISFSIKNLELFEQIALQTIQNAGFNYDCSVSIGQYDFPTKEYDNVRFPSGTYDALKIEIGSANGQNWWCVMFPPLCFTTTSTGILEDKHQTTLESNLISDSHDILYKDENPNVTFKFKIVEFFGSL